MRLSTRGSEFSRWAGVMLCGGARRLCRRSEQMPPTVFRTKRQFLALIACILEYVDNFACLGASKLRVDQLSSAGIAVLWRRGLVVHEEETGKGDTKVLGWQFKLRTLPHRILRLVFAMQHLLRSGACSRKQLERILGHATFVGLGRREILSVFGESYGFVRAHYHYPHKLLPIVSRDLDCTCSLTLERSVIPLVRGGRCRRREQLGLGATSSEFPVEQVRNWDDSRSGGGLSFLSFAVLGLQQWESNWEPKLRSHLSFNGWPVGLSRLACNH